MSKQYRIGDALVVTTDGEGAYEIIRQFRTAGRAIEYLRRLAEDVPMLEDTLDVMQRRNKLDVWGNPIVTADGSLLTELVYIDWASSDAEFALWQHGDDIRSFDGLNLQRLGTACAPVAVAA